MTRCTYKLAGFATAIVKPAGVEESAPTTERKNDGCQRSNSTIAEQAPVDIPVGGSTGLSHTDPGRIELAARYIATTPRTALPQPLAPTLQRMFGLTDVEAVEAVAEARLILARAT